MQELEWVVKSFQSELEFSKELNRGYKFVYAQVCKWLNDVQAESFVMEKTEGDIIVYARTKRN